MEIDDPVSEPARVRAAQAGDPEALEELVQAYLPLVQAIAARALDHHADADDVVQETMVRAVSHLRDLRDPDRFRPWIVAITVRQARERTRRVRRRGPEVSLESLLDDPVAAHDVAEQVASDVDGAAQREAFEESIHWLEPDEQQVLALWQLELDGKITRDDLAEGLGIGRSHAAVRVHRLKGRVEQAREIVAALQRAPICPDLSRITRSWDGATTSIWRKRLHRHVNGCDYCGAASHNAFPIDRLLASALLAPLPVAVAFDAARVAATAPATAPVGSFHQVISALWAKPAAMLATVAAGTAIAVTATVWPVTNWGPGIPDPPARAAAAPQSSPTVAPSPSLSPSPSAAAAPTTTARRTTTPAVVSTRYGRILYLAPNGDDSGPGTLSKPLRTVAKALTVVEPGQTILLRAGTYTPAEPLVANASGTKAKPITMTSYRDEKVTLDGGKLTPSGTLLELRGSHWVLSKLEVRHAPRFGLTCRSCSDTTFERLDVHDNGLSGLLLTGEGTSRNSVLDSDFHDNHDDATRGENADGLEIKDGSGAGNLVRGVRTYDNADDGLSTWNFRSPVRVVATWSFGNGYNRWNVAGDWAGNGVGFKLGGADGASPKVAHVVENSAAWDNLNIGFSANRNEGALYLERNTSYRNHNRGFWVPGAGAYVGRNVSVGDSAGVDLGPHVQVAGNSWQGSRPNTTEFLSTDASVAEGKRRADWSLPTSDYLIPTKTHAGASMSAVPFPD